MFFGMKFRWQSIPLLHLAHIPLPQPLPYVPIPHSSPLCPSSPHIPPLKIPSPSPPATYPFFVHFSWRFMASSLPWIICPRYTGFGLFSCGFVISFPQPASAPTGRGREGEGDCQGVKRERLQTTNIQEQNIKYLTHTPPSKVHL